MCLTLTNEDVLRAYKVYKSVDRYLGNIPADEKDTYVILSTLLVLYDGLSPLEVQKAFLLTKSYAKRIISNGVTKYRIFTFDKDLVLGRHTLCGTLSKGVLRLNDQMLKAILRNEESMLPNKKVLDTFAVMLSNTSAHVKIVKNNVLNVSSSSLLSYIRMLFNMLVNKQVHNENDCLDNLARLGYMRICGNNIELNKNALLYNKEPHFELSTI